MKKSLSIIIVLVVFLFPLVSASSSFFVPKDSVYDLKFGVSCQGNLCPTSTSCNLSISLPNSTILIDNLQATNLNNGFFNVTLNENQTAIKGEHLTCAYCSQNGINDSQCFYYEVNPAGIRPTDQKTDAISRGVWFLFGIAILLFVGFLFLNSSEPVKWTFFFLSFLFFLVALNVIFVGLSDEVINPRLETFFDGFTAISFIMYWGIAGVLALIWFLTFFNTYFYKKNLNNARRFGSAGF